MAFPVELALFCLLIVTALVVARLRDLFAAAMLTGIFSLVSAGLFTLMDAVDVAFTEAAVGAGITTVLMLGTLSVTARSENQQAFRLRPLLMVIVIGAALVYGTIDMPKVGDATSPANSHPKVAEHYITKSKEEVGPANFVTSVLGDYRGYDTMGETIVIFTAALCVLLLLRQATVTGRRDED